MAKHLTDTLQQQHLAYIHAVPTGGSAESAQELRILDGEYDRDFLGTIQEESPHGILNMYEDESGKGDEESERVSSTIRAAPVSHNAADSAARVSRRKSVTFSPLFPRYNITHYSVVRRAPHGVRFRREGSHG